jgi:hypothetical protein
LSCTNSNPYQRQRGPRDKRNDPADAASRQFYLTSIKLNNTAISGGARKLFFEAPAGAADGVRRRSEGYFIFNKDGGCRTAAAVAEPVIGLGGRRNEHRYQLLKFWGQMNKGGDEARGLKSPSVQGGVEALHLTWRGEEELEVRPVVQGRPTAYIYHFRRSSLPNKNVPFPY